MPGVQKPAPWKASGAAALAGIFFGMAASPSLAQTPAEFYKGKNINLIIGYSTGGGYDAYARLLAMHLGKYIPGNPTIVPQNLVGAGSLRAALYLDGVAPKDGTVIGTFGRNIPIDPLMDTTGSAKFDGRKLSWIGSISSDVSLCISRDTSQIKTWQDMLTKQYTVGGNQAGSDPDMFAMLIKGLFDAKIKLVSGYPGTADISLAMERGEVDGFCGLSYSTLKAQHPEWIRDKKINLLLQASIAKEPDLPDVPLITDLVKTPEQLKVLKLLVASQVMARPYAAPPGIPADRKAALQKAFADTVKDPAFLADAKRLKLDVHPLGPEAIQKLLDEVYATPSEDVQRAVQILATQPPAPAKP
jgi:tripartite-type tricarboxylate transporter receptor subunit TctC